MVGVNRFTIDEEERELTLHEYNENVAKEQVQSLIKVRNKRDTAKVDKHLEQLRRAAKSDENLMPYLIEAFRDYVSLGEICRVFKEEFGTFQQPTIF